MSDIIRLLPDSVANQIAAGEVIQRPASVVKELVENAIDAGASHIHVLVTDAGKTCIQVIDDGKGMSETDARLSFERHATSKIRMAADLFSLDTMGFRGEALASIAAVAQVELKTRMASDELGTKICISGSRVESQEPVSCSQGCNFSVKNLFFNVPARRKFLKANSTELSNVTTEFERISLVNPQVSFTLYSNDTEVMNLPACALRLRIMNVFGKKLNQQLLEVDVETTMVKVHGYVAKPETARKKGARQYFFVNGRYMRHPYFHKAVMEAYDQLIPVGEQVSYFLYFEVDPANIDVNIHPTKTEIKFENEQSIWQILSAAVKETLGKFNAVPTIDFDTEDMPDIPAFETDSSIRPPQVHYNTEFNPFNVANNSGPFSAARESGSSASHTSKMNGGGDNGQMYVSRASYKDDGSNVVPDNWADLYEGAASMASRMNGGTEQDAGDVFGQPHDEMTSILEPSEIGTPHPAAESGDIFAGAEHHFSSAPEQVEKGNQQLQFKGRFILTSIKSGLMLIDQHRAHVRILYDRYMARIVSKRGISQGVLFPEVIQLPQSEVAILHNIMDDLSYVGFDLSDLGNGNYSINGVPSEIAGVDPEQLIHNMLHAAVEKGSDVKEEIQSLMALTLARAAAICYGQALSADEMSSLVDELFACQSPNYTPDGKTILVTVREDDIEKMFR